MEMTSWGKRGKPISGFPPFPQDLEIAAAISTFPQRRRGMEKWKTKSRFPTFPRSGFSLHYEEKTNRMLRMR